MLLSKTIKIKINYANLQKYIDRGYVFDTFINSKGNKSVKRGLSLEVDINDIDANCCSLISYKCDYCDTIVEVRYNDYMRHNDNGVKRGKDACLNCNKHKVKEVFNEKYGGDSPYSSKEVRDKRDLNVMNKYGVDNVFKLETVKNKILDTNLNKYGKEYYTQTDEYKDRYINTCMNMYGVTNVSKSKEIIEKIKLVHFEKYGSYYSQTQESKDRYKETCIEKYGVENLFQCQFVKDRILEYNYDTYGVSHPMKLEDIKNDRVIKMNNTKHRNATGQSSRQQDYLHKLYGGEINYPMDRCLLDIALVDDNVVCEYDGSGHALSVMFGSVTMDEFIKKERNRKYYLFSMGWKEFRIISNKDNLPSDKKLIEMKTIAMEWFADNHKWIKFHIDFESYETSEGFIDFDYGTLRKIRQSDLETI